MKDRTINAKVAKGDRAGTTYSINVSFPENIQEAVDAWGDGVIFARLVSAYHGDLQTMMRKAIKEDGFNEGALQETASSWKPKARGKGKSRQ